jgi:predicted transcriptional regulator
VQRRDYAKLSRRERQIMDVIYRLGAATALNVRQELPDPPSYSAGRATLRILEDKGALTHSKQGPRYVFSPTEPTSTARRFALRQLLTTFFEDSPEQALAALLDDSREDLSDDEPSRMMDLVEAARSARSSTRASPGRPTASTPSATTRR